jgi:hypothetical protein
VRYELHFDPDAEPDDETVVFAPIVGDEHELRLRLTVSRDSWQAQGSPEVLHVTMTQPRREPAT